MLFTVRWDKVNGKVSEFLAYPPALLRQYLLPPLRSCPTQLSGVGLLLAAANFTSVIFHTPKKKLFLVTVC
jgi:hypothetical protein